MTPIAATDGCRIAVLASGGGSNLGAILAHLHSLGARRGGNVVLVASDRSTAGALARARERDIAASHLTDPGDADAFDRLFRDHAVDLIVLAGYLRLIPAAVTRRFQGRMLNVHPALLPAFGGAGMYGARVHRAVVEAGARISGVTVHFVDETYDRGPIIAQWPVPVEEKDTPESLAARVLRVEHVLYPRVVNAVAGGRIVLGPDGRVRGAGQARNGSVFSLGSPGGLAEAIERALG